MLYSILCYNCEAEVGAWSRTKDDAVMAHHAEVIQRLTARGKCGPVLRLLPTTTATTVRAGRKPVVLDGPFAETKEQLLGFFVVDCDTLQDVIDIASELTLDTGAMEIRPVHFFAPGSGMS
jgi:hypothetical protein